MYDSSKWQSTRASRQRGRGILSSCFSVNALSRARDAERNRAPLGLKCIDSRGGGKRLLHNR